jgi:endonuclease/exonuclease/phosphatase family metal-dependent hydrolase
MGSTHSRLFAAASAAIAVGGCLLTPAVANASSTRLTPPKSVHAFNVTSSSFKVSAKARNATRYKVFVSRTKRNVYVANLHKAKVVTSRQSTVAITGLHYSTTPYYYRVESFKGSHHRYGSYIGSVGLLPATPSDLVASTGPGGVSLTWKSGPASGFQVVESTSYVFPDDAARRVYTITGLDRQFSPPDLMNGQQYFFRVFALNGSSRSPHFAATPSIAPVIPATSQQTVKVMTYNLLTVGADGQHEGDGTVAPWMAGSASNDSASVDRVFHAAQLVEEGDPDVVALEEGAGCARAGAPQPCMLQADSLAQRLNGYTRADTEIDPPAKNWVRTSDYLLYKTAEFTPMLTAGHWEIGAAKYNRFAVYQALKNNATGAEFLMVGTHLIVGNSNTLDLERKDETNDVLNFATTYAKNHLVNGNPMPIVYAGDFNSDQDARVHPIDGPTIAMRARGINSSSDVATSLENAKYNSANQYYRHPPTSGYHIDYIWAPPGVAVTDWHQFVDVNAKGDFIKGPIPSDHNPVMATVEYPY